MNPNVRALCTDFNVSSLKYIWNCTSVEGAVLQRFIMVKVMCSLDPIPTCLTFRLIENILYPFNFTPYNIKITFQIITLYIRTGAEVHFPSTRTSVLFFQKIYIKGLPTKLRSKPPGAHIYDKKEQFL